MFSPTSAPSSRAPLLPSLALGESFRCNLCLDEDPGLFQESDEKFPDWRQPPERALLIEDQFQRSVFSPMPDEAPLLESVRGRDRGVHFAVASVASPVPPCVVRYSAQELQHGAAQVEVQANASTVRPELVAVLTSIRLLHRGSFAADSRSSTNGKSG